MRTQTKDGYTVGQVVKLKLPVVDENGQELKTNDLVRIVAIASKVYKVTGDEYHDNKDYFIVAVRHDQELDYGGCIHVNFCVIKKV